MPPHHFFKIRLARLASWNAEKALGLWGPFLEGPDN